MRDFSISCEYLENIRSLSEEFPEYRDRIYTIIINETFKIELPLIVASSFSSSVTKTVKNDPTANELHVRLSTLKTQETLEKIKSVLFGQSKVSLNEENDVFAFAEFGAAIGNKDFVNPLNAQLAKEAAEIKEDNVVRILLSKKTFHVEDTERESSFIAEHFETMSTREDFINFSREATNARTVEAIISSDKLFMRDEDTLLSFLMRINESKTIENISVELFSHLFLEYCSPDKCNEFITFVYDIVQQQSIKALVSCIKRRFIQPNIPMNQRFVEGRHERQEILIGSEDPLNGILHREHEKGNVSLEASSINGSNFDGVYNLVKANDNSYFLTKNIPNSFVAASLKDGKTFIVKSYMIRGNRGSDNNSQIRSWKFEGQKASNGEWIVLDSHQNDPIKKLEVKTFNVSCEEELKSVRITQTGTNTHNDNHLHINAFDIFGVLCYE